MQAGMRFRAIAAVVALLVVPSTGIAAKQKKPKAPAPPPLEAIRTPYVVADVDSGRVIEEFDALRPWFPASTTKLMTIYTTFRAIQAGEIKLDSTVTYSANAAKEPPAKMGFPLGTTFTLDNALKMMMVKSANDIAVSVAEAVGGSVPGFAGRMNAEAKRLGMSRSHFANPNGLTDPENYTSARDMALVARALLTDFPQYRSYFNLPGIEIGGRVLRNFNTLLDRYPGAEGMKTGFICASGYNLVALAKHGDREVIAVVFGEYGAKERMERAAKLLDEGFASPVPTGTDFTTLATAKTGVSYHQPFDMHDYVCGPRRVRSASGAEDDDDRGSSQSHLSAERLDIGPPVQVSAVAPTPPAAPETAAASAEAGDTGPGARLPRPRPGSGQASPDALNAYAPGDDSGDSSAPAAAIGAAAGTAQPLGEVAPH